MMDQMCLDMVVSDERKAFDLIYPELSDIILNAPIDSGILIFEELKNFSSVYFMDSNELFFRIRLRKKSRYILVPENYMYLFPPDTETSMTKSDAGMVRIVIQSYEDILKYVSVLRAILDQICRNNRDFGCCGRYIECSDAGTCLHPDPKFSLGCWYRYHLDEGKVFYGKNRNIP